MAVTYTKEVYRKETIKTKESFILTQKDIKAYAEMDLDELLAKLSPDELEELSNMVDPDDSMIPPSDRCRNQTNKKPTGPLDRKKLLAFLEKVAKEQEDWPEAKPFQPGVKRGKIWVPRELPKPKQDGDLEVELDLGDEYETVLNTAAESELVDLAAILGLHSMLNQDQYHASLTNKGQSVSAKFESIVKASMPRALPMEPDNITDVYKTAQQVANNDSSLTSLNWNNIKNVRREDFTRMFEGLKRNTNLKTLSLANTDLTDTPAHVLVEALKENKTLSSLNVESNYISGPTLRDMVDALLTNQTVLEFRAVNQRPIILGNKIEMDIAKLIEQNDTILRLGISFDVPDARVRVTQHLQKNNDHVRLRRIGTDS